MTDRQIVYRDPAGLKGYVRNTRLHSEAQIKAIRRSIDEFGFNNPVLLKDDEATIGAGHARIAAALLEPVLASVPTITLHGLTEDKWRAYVIADNRLAEKGATWDFDLLRIELQELDVAGFDIDLTGFTFGDLPGGKHGLTDPDDVPPPPAVPVSRLGDAWVLGDHRLVCGDCTKAEDVALALNGATPHLMVTDPPYGVNYDADWRNSAARSGATSGRARGVIGGRAVGKVINDDRADWREAWQLFPGDVAYVWHGALKGGIVADSLASVGLEARSQIIWAKNNIVVGRGNYHFKHEPCWYAVRKGGKSHWNGDRTQATVWSIDKPMKSETGHSTQKPVDCMARPMLNNSKQGDLVYDPFMGSGTAAIAAEINERRCIGLELSPAYCDVIVLRWQGFTGKAATLDGKIYAEVEKERAAIKTAPTSKPKRKAAAKRRGKPARRRPSPKRSPAADPSSPS